MAKLSVVMPVYREKERFVRQAIEYILNQTLSDFNYIILLDDPDNDALKKVISEYAENDSRIQVPCKRQKYGVSVDKKQGNSIECNRVCSNYGCR